MLKEEYEEKEITEVKRVLVSEKLVCDVCGKEIAKEERYYEATTHHDDWGIDSCDSYEKFDLCSDKCLIEKFNEYLKNNYDTKKIEICKTIHH